MPYGSSSDSGWKPGKNKTINTPRTTSKNPARKAAAAFARSGNDTRSSGYGSPTATAPKKSEPKAPKKQISSATAASFVGKPYGSSGNTPPAAQRAAARVTGRTPSSPSAPKAGQKATNMAEKLRTRNFKGKYFGPDEFKGDMAKLRKWKSEGKKRNSDGSPKV